MPFIEENPHYRVYALSDEVAPYTETIKSSSVDSSIIVMEVKNVEPVTPAPQPFFNQKDIQKIDKWRHSISCDYLKVTPPRSLSPSPPSPPVVARTPGVGKRPSPSDNDEMYGKCYYFNEKKRCKLQKFEDWDVVEIDEEEKEAEEGDIFDGFETGNRGWHSLGREWEVARGYY